MASYLHYLSIYTRFRIMDLVFGAPDPKPSLFGGPFWKLTIKLLIITKQWFKQQVYNEKKKQLDTDRSTKDSI